MREVLDTAGMRGREEAAEHLGLSTEALMERAGSALAEELLRQASERARFVFVCGPGNNGGDGFVAARQLLAKGRSVVVSLAGDPNRLADAAAKSARAFSEVGGELRPLLGESDVGKGDVVVDAVFGTGVNRAPSGAAAEAIQRMCQWRREGAWLVAVDIPSGVQSDTGVAYSPYVEANHTVVLGRLKIGNAVEPGASLCGTRTVVGIGLPPGPASPLIGELEESDIQRWLPKRAAESHKGTFGHLLVIAGSRGKSGSAALAALGGLRAGAGLVTVATQSDVLGEVLGHAPEIMGHEVHSPLGMGPKDWESIAVAAEKKQAVVFGPGIARGSETPKFLEEMLRHLEVPCLIDADGLNALAGNLKLLQGARAPVVLTPHPGEMARLLGVTTQVVQRDRMGIARSFAREHKVVLVLKGARTVVALPSGEIRINPTGNAGMATAGTGDVLSGIIGALLAQGQSPEVAACVGVYAHGLAGDWVRRERGQMGLIASDLLKGLSRIWATWAR